MPIRFASLTKRIAENGLRLHRAIMKRGADQAPSEDEQALIDERRRLQEDQGKRRARSLEPKPSAVQRLVRTHHAEPKEKPKSSKELAEAKAAKKPKARRSRAEKHAERAAAIEAARRSPKKPATK
jgi:hypothetical protein